MFTDGDAKQVFARFCNISHSIKNSIESDGGKFMFTENLGFIGTCPSNLGTGLRASVMICLPELNKDVHALEEICDNFQLQPRVSADEHSAAVGATLQVLLTQIPLLALSLCLLRHCTNVYYLR